MLETLLSVVSLLRPVWSHWGHVGLTATCATTESHARVAHVVCPQNRNAKS